MAHKVIAECVDRRSGKRFHPGDWFLPAPDEDQEERLGAARCIKVVDDAEMAWDIGNTVDDPAGKARQQINEDGLFDQTVDALKAIAVEESIDLGEAKRKDEIVAAIRSAREASA